MIFRRIKAHVENENWFAVGIDFCIVVIGVFIGIQVANWNEARTAQETEDALIQRLDEEFDIIAAAFDETLETLPVYFDATKTILGIAREEFDRSEAELKRTAYLSNNLGRPPLKSATYEQLVASGDLKFLQDSGLRHALVRYHQSVDRQAFLYPQTLDQILSLPDFIDVPLRSTDMDLEFPAPQDIIDDIIVDRRTLKESEGELEGLLTLQFNLLRAAIDQNERVEDVQAALDEAMK